MRINDVYLCIKQNNYNCNYNCKQFNDFVTADEHYNKYYKNNVSFSTMIPICRFNPFYTISLKYKLFKMFYLNIKN